MCIKAVSYTHLISYLNKDFKESEKMTKVQDGLFKFINEAAEGVAVADMNPEDYFERIAYSIFREWYSKSVNIEELKAEFFERNEEVESFNDGLKDKLDKFYGFIEDVYGKAEAVSYTHLDVYKRQSYCSSKNGTKIQLMNRNGNIAQLFRIKYEGNGEYTINTGASLYNSSVDILGGNTTNATINQWANNGLAPQRWKITKSGNGYVFRSVINENLVLDASGASNGCLLYTSALLYWKDMMLP